MLEQMEQTGSEAGRADAEHRDPGGEPVRPVSRRRRAARKTLATLPTMFTLGNGLCGFIAIFLASRNPSSELAFGWTPLTWASLFVFLGMVMDGLDGRLARLTNNTSDLGGQLDSMSDMVTFGVAPAFMAVMLVGIQTPFFADKPDAWFDRATLIVASIYVACAALRLARFNIELTDDEHNDHLSFKGLPTPGAGGTLAALILLHQHMLHHYDVMLQSNPGLDPPTRLRVMSIGMVVVMAMVAWAMVCSVRYAHVMNRYVRGRAPFPTIVKVVVVALLLAIWPQGSLAAAFVVYAVSGPATWLYRKATGKPTPRDELDDEEEMADEF